MTIELQNLENQVIVITGASSGIGLTTARMAAKRGARLVLAARSEDALDELTQEIIADGGDAIYVDADVSNQEDVREIARVAQDEYGGFDTWVNGAAISIYGTLEETPVEEMRQLFDVNVWGVVYGSLEAANHMRNRGGAIINIGSVLSDRAVLLQGSYSASKHAVKGFTDALRIELEEEDAPVSVTLIKPSAIDTPYPQHAKNHMDKEASLPSPVYAPETVARAILHAAEHSDREVTVGGGGKGLAVLGRFAPDLMDTIMEMMFIGEQQRNRRQNFDEENGLDGPSGTLEERGRYKGHVSETSLYTRLRQRRDGPHVAIIGLAVMMLYVGFKAIRRSDER